MPLLLKTLKRHALERHLVRFGRQLHSEIRDQDPTEKRSLAAHLMASVAPGKELSRFIPSLSHAVYGKGVEE